MFRFATTRRPWFNLPVILLTQGLLDPVSSRKRAKGRLPLTRRWRTIFVVFRVIAWGTATIGVVAIVSAEIWAWPQWIVGFGFGLLGASFVAFVLYAGLRPKGVVHGLSSGEEWVHLTDVHPNFVAGIDATRSQGGSISTGEQ
jgi:hypothetical protein